MTYATAIVAIQPQEKTKKQKTKKIKTERAPKVSQSKPYSGPKTINWAKIGHAQSAS